MNFTRILNCCLSVTTILLFYWLILTSRLSGPGERLRGEELISRILVIPDQQSPKTENLMTSGNHEHQLGSVDFKVSKALNFLVLILCHLFNFIYGKLHEICATFAQKLCNPFLEVVQLLGIHTYKIYSEVEIILSCADFMFIVNARQKIGFTSEIKVGNSKNGDSGKLQPLYDGLHFCCSLLQLKLRLKLPKSAKKLHKFWVIMKYKMSKSMLVLSNNKFMKQQIITNS